MDRQFLKDGLGWGFVLWLIGYILGFVFFFFVPAGHIGWYIMPFGTLITIWIAFRFIKSKSWQYYFSVGLVWTASAVILDYIFLVQLLNPADGYYKLDVYVYYALTLFLPVLAGWHKSRKKERINN